MLSLQPALPALSQAEACATQADPAACNDLVDTWWTVMASILYPSLIVPADFCVYLGNCQMRDWRPRTGDWTCEDCTNGLEFAAGYLADEQVVAAAISILQGDVFCGAAGATPDCADQVSTALCCTALQGAADGRLAAGGAAGPGRGARRPEGGNLPGGGRSLSGLKHHKPSVDKAILKTIFILHSMCGCVLCSVATIKNFTHGSSRAT